MSPALFHVTANNCLAHGLTLTGGKLVHMYKWDALEALKLVEREGITNVTGVPVMSRELISHPDFTNTTLAPCYQSVVVAHTFNRISSARSTNP